MAGRKKIEDSLKLKTSSIQFTEKERAEIEKNGQGKTFSQKVKSLIFWEYRNMDLS